ncbi:MAG: MarR family transcriptional regulator [Planctomycetes bacterium]|nr:MarR family transcriptional regulator [Planctomycetota bacterium]
MGTRYRGSPGAVRALNAYVALVRAAESVTARLQPRIDRAGLTVSQFGALEALLHLGPLCQKELGTKLLKSGGNITMVVDNLERRGLARRVRGEDRRFMAVHLAPAGRRLLRRIFPGHVEAIVREMAILSAVEQKKLRVLCRMLGLQERRDA